MARNLDQHGIGYFAGVGIVAGVIAGMAMAMFIMIVTLAGGMGLFATPEMIGQTFLKGQTGFASIVLGLMGHMMNSAVFGVIWALLWRAVAKTGAVAILGGLIYGLAIWLVMTYGVAPALGSAVPGPISPIAWVMGHMMFGFVLGLLPIFKAEAFEGEQPNRATA